MLLNFNSLTWSKAEIYDPDLCPTMPIIELVQDILFQLCIRIPTLCSLIVYFLSFPAKTHTDAHTHTQRFWQAVVTINKLIVSFFVYKIKQWTLQSTNVKTNNTLYV